MGIFGDDELQDKRIAALERHIRTLTETVQANQTDLAESQISIFSLQALLNEKVSASDIDPTIVKLNEDLAVAREQLEKSSAAASESWAALQDDVRDSFDSLRTSVQQAYEQIKKA